MPDLITTAGEVRSKLPYVKGIVESLETLPDEAEVSLSQVLEEHGTENALRFLQCFDYVKYCELPATIAKSVLHIFEESYPEDKRPRKAIEAIYQFKAGDIDKEELTAAADVAIGTVAYAAYATVYAAYSAAGAAGYAAYDNAYAAANTAGHAAYANAYAADASDFSAADAYKAKWQEIRQMVVDFIEV